VYGVNAKTPFVESDPIFSAISPYAASKLRARRWGTSITMFTDGRGMLRFFTVYGPPAPDLAIHKFAKLISSANPSRVRDGSAARDYTYVSDTVDGVMACTKKDLL